MLVSTGDITASIFFSSSSPALGLVNKPNNFSTSPSTFERLLSASVIAFLASSFCPCSFRMQRYGLRVFSASMSFSCRAEYSASATRCALGANFFAAVIFKLTCCLALLMAVSALLAAFSTSSKMAVTASDKSSLNSSSNGAAVLAQVVKRSSACATWSINPGKESSSAFASLLSACALLALSFAALRWSSSSWPFAAARDLALATSCATLAETHLSLGVSFRKAATSLGVCFLASMISAANTLWTSVNAVC
mmetsp:Transcript_93821/g.148178  ORF Transcript_93821/g.148178 Transcript_93821/m.148178 type:complete len:252 (+) Transcript_93821:4701-5456(+)